MFASEGHLIKQSLKLEIFSPTNVDQKLISFISMNSSDFCLRLLVDSSVDDLRNRWRTMSLPNKVLGFELSQFKKPYEHDNDITSKSSKMTGNANRHSSAEMKVLNITPSGYERFFKSNFPVAPDCFVPNSVIREKLQTLKHYPECANGRSAKKYYLKPVLDDSRPITAFSTLDEVWSSSSEAQYSLSRQEYDTSMSEAKEQPAMNPQKQQHLYGVHTRKELSENFEAKQLISCKTSSNITQKSLLPNTVSRTVKRSKNIHGCPTLRESGFDFQIDSIVDPAKNEFTEMRSRRCSSSFKILLESAQTVLQVS